MSTERKTPRRRFKEFQNSEDWEKHKLIDILVQPITDGPHETPELVENGVPFISVDAIIDNKIDFNRRRGNITEEYNEMCCRKYKPKLNDVYLVKSGSTVGKVAIVETTERFNIWSPLAAIRCGEKSQPYFLYFLLQTENLQAQVFDKCSHGTQPNLSMRELEKFNVFIPSIEEQNMIAEHLKKLDTSITLHQSKLEKLKSLKKAYLSQMFPSEGECKPKLRFDGFNDEWEQRKLGDEAIEIVAGGDIDKSKIRNYGRYPVIANALVNDGIVGYYNDDFRINAPAVTVTGRGDVGHAKARKINFTPVVRLLSIKSKHNVDFLEHAINNCNVIIESTGIPQLTVPQLLNYKIYFPKTIDEEIAIGKLFTRLENVITIHQRKLEKLQNLKKAYLNEMFI